MEGCPVIGTKEQELVNAVGMKEFYRTWMEHDGNIPDEVYQEILASQDTDAKIVNDAFDKVYIPVERSSVAPTETENIAEVEKWWANTFEGIPLDTNFQDMIVEGGQKYMAIFNGAMVKLARGAEKGTAYHEAFHVAMYMYHTPAQIEELRAEAREKYGKILSNRQIDEVLANKFKVYMLSPKREIKETGYLGKLFHAFRNWINHVLGNDSKIDKLFKNIESGKFKRQPSAEAYKLAEKLKLPKVITSAKFDIETVTFMSNWLLQSIQDVKEEGEDKINQLRIKMKTRLEIMEETASNPATKENLKTVVDNFDEYFEKSKSFMKKRFGIDIIEGATDEDNEMDTEVRKAWDDTARFKENYKDSMSQMIKKLFMTTQKIHNGVDVNNLQVDKNGKFIYPYDTTNYLGSATFIDYETVLPFVARVLAGSTSFEDMMDRLDTIIDFEPSLIQIKHKLAVNDSLKGAFWTTFNMQTPDVKVILKEDVGGETVLNGQIANDMAKADKKLANKWSLNIQINQSSKKYTTDNYKAVSQIQREIETGELTLPAMIDKVHEAMTLLGLVIPKDALERAFNSNVFSRKFSNRNGDFQAIYNNVFREPISKLNSAINNVDKFKDVGNLNKLAQLLVNFHYEVNESSYLNVNGDLVYSLVKPNFLSETFKIFKTVKDNPTDAKAQEGLKKYLLEFTHEAGMEHSNWLFGKFGFLIANEDGSYDLNMKGLEKFDYALYGGFKDTFENKGFEYADMDDKDWILSQVHMYLDNIDKDKINTSIPIPSDAGVIYSITSNRFSSSLNEDGTLNEDSDLYRAIENTVKQEIARIKDASQLLFSVDTTGNLSIKDGLDITQLEKNYHWKTQGVLLRNAEGTEHKGRNYPTGQGLEFKNMKIVYPDGSIKTLNDVKTAEGLSINELIYRGLYDEATHKPLIDAFVKEWIADRQRATRETLETFDKDKSFDAIPNYKVINRSFNKLATEIALNTYLSIVEQNNFFNGLISEHKNGNQVNKRAKETISPGNGLWTKREFFTSATLADIELETKHFVVITNGVANSLKAFKKFQKTSIDANKVIEQARKSEKARDLSTLNDLELETFKIVSKYAKTTTTDGQGYITIARYKEILEGLGRFDGYYRRMFNILETQYKELKETGEITTKFTQKDLKRMLEPVKGFYYDRKFDSYTKRMVSNQVKYSTIPLIPQLVAGTDLEKLMYHMTDKQIDELVYESAEKVGVTHAAQIADKEGKLTEDFASAIVPKSLTNSAWRLQQDNPNHLMDYESSIGTQLAKLVIDNLNGEYELNGKNLNPDNLVQHYMNLVAANIKDDFHELATKLGLEQVNGKWKITNLDMVQESLLNEIKSRGLGENFEDALQYVSDDMKQFKLPLYISSMTKKYESIILSMFDSKVRKRKQLGGMAVLFSSAFTQKKTLEQVTGKVWYQGIKSDTFDNREYNYFAQSEAEAKNYGDKTRKVKINSKNPLNYYELVDGSKKERKGYVLNDEFKKKTNKWFDILDNSKEGLETQNEFFDFVKSQGYDTVDFTKSELNHDENMYVVTLDNSIISNPDENNSGIEWLDSYTKEHGTELKMSTVQDDKVTEIACLLPAYSKDFFDEHGGRISINELEKLAPDLLTIIGYRIPTETKHSMVVLKVAGFLPQESGGTIVLPQEVVTQSGADFDIDKLFLLMYAFSKNEDGSLHRVTYDESKTEEENGKLARQNRILDIFRSILQNPVHYAESMMPNSFDKFTQVKNDQDALNLRDIKHVNSTTFEGQNGFRKANIAGRALKALAVNAKGFTTIGQVANMRLRDNLGFQFKYTENLPEIRKRYAGNIVEDTKEYVVVNHTQIGKAPDGSYLTSNGSMITDNLGSLVANILDIVAEPLPENINLYTFQSYAAMLMTGVEPDIASWFVSQPVMNTLAKTSFEKKGIISEDDNKAIQDTKNLYLKELLKVLNILNKNKVEFMMDKVTKKPIVTADGNKLIKLQYNYQKNGIKHSDSIILAQSPDGVINFPRTKGQGDNQVNLFETLFGFDAEKTYAPSLKELTDDYKEGLTYKLTSISPFTGKEVNDGLTEEQLKDKARLLRRQLQLLETFNKRYKKAGEAIKDGIKVTSFDRTSVGPDFSKMIGIEEEMERLDTYQAHREEKEELTEEQQKQGLLSEKQQKNFTARLLIGDKSFVRAIYPNFKKWANEEVGNKSAYPLLETFYHYAFKTSLEAFQEHFISTADSWRGFKKNFYSVYRITPSEATNKQLDNFLNYVVSNDFNKYSKSKFKQVLGIDNQVIPTDVTIEEFKKLSAAQKVWWIKNNRPDIVADEYNLLNLLNPQLKAEIKKDNGKTLMRSDYDRNDNTHVIKMDASTTNFIVDDYIKDSFAEMLDSADDFVRETALDLIDYAFMTNALQYKAGSFAKYIPNSHLVDIGYGDYLRGKADEILSKDNYFDRYFETFIKNNATNTDFVPLVRTEYEENKEGDTVVKGSTAKREKADWNNVKEGVLIVNKSALENEGKVKYSRFVMVRKGFNYTLYKRLMEDEFGVENVDKVFYVPVNNTANRNYTNLFGESFDASKNTTVDEDFAKNKAQEWTKTKEDNQLPAVVEFHKAFRNNKIDIERLKKYLTKQGITLVENLSNDFKPVGSFNHRTNVITLYSSDSSTEAQKYSAILHELIHAETIDTLADYLSQSKIISEENASEMYIGRNYVLGIEEKQALNKLLGYIQEVNSLISKAVKSEHSLEYFDRNGKYAKRGYESIDYFDTISEETSYSYYASFDKKATQLIEFLPEIYSNPNLISFVKDTNPLLLESIYKEADKLFNAKIQESRQGFGSPESLTEYEEKKQALIKMFADAGKEVTVIEDFTLEGAGQIQEEDGKLVIRVNPSNMTGDTLFHEFGHMLVDSVSNEVRKAGVDQLRDEDLWQQVAELYPDLSEEDLAKEVLTTAIGIEADKLWRTEKEKSNWRLWLENFFRKVAKAFGVEESVAKQLARQLVTGNLSKTIKLQVENKRRDQRVKKTLADLGWNNKFLEEALTDIQTQIETKQGAYQVNKMQELKQLVEDMMVKDEIASLNKYAEWVTKNVAHLQNQFNNYANFTYAEFEKMTDEEKRNLATFLREANEFLHHARKVEDLEFLTETMKNMSFDGMQKGALIETLKGIEPIISDLKNKWFSMSQQFAIKYVDISSNKEFGGRGKVENVDKFFSPQMDETYTQLLLDALFDTNHPLVANLIKQYNYQMFKAHDETIQRTKKWKDMVALAEKAGVNVNDFVRDDTRIINETDYYAFYKARYEFFQELAKKTDSDTEMYSKEVAKWFTAHTVRKTKEEMERIAKEKQAYMTTKEYSEWKDTVVKKVYNEDGSTRYIYMNEFTKPNPKLYRNAKFDALVGEEGKRTEKQEVAHKFYTYLTTELASLVEHTQDNIIKQGYIPAVPMIKVDSFKAGVSAVLNNLGFTSKNRVQEAGNFDAEGDIVQHLPLAYMNLLAQDKFEPIPKDATEEQIKEIRKRNNDTKKKNREAHADSVVKDLREIMPLFISEATKHKYKTLIEDEMLVTKELMKQSKVVKTNGVGGRVRNLAHGKISGAEPKVQTIEGDNSNTYAHLDKWMKMVFYGDFEMDEGRLQEVAGLLKNYVSLKGLGFNYLAGANNYIFGKTMVFNERLGNQFFGGESYRKAIKDVNMSIGSYIAAFVGNPTGADYSTADKTAAIMHYMDILQTADEFDVKNGDKAKAAIDKIMMFRNFAFFQQHIGEFFVQNEPLIAMMHETRIIDGRLVNYKEFLEMLYEKENLLLVQKTNIDPLDKEIAAKRKEIRKTAKEEFAKYKTLHEAVEFSDGKLHWDKLGLKENELAEFRNKVIGVNQYLHGIYNKDDASTLNHYALGRLAMQFRKWMRPGWNRRFGARFGESYHNERRGVKEEGMYVSTFNFLFKPAIDNFQVLDADKNFVMFKAFGNILSGYREYLKNATVNWESLDETQKANVRRTIGEILTIIAITGLGMMLRSWKKKHPEVGNWFNYVMYEQDRLRMDNLTYTPIYGWFNEGKKLLRSPAAAVTVLEDAIRVLADIASMPFLEQDEESFKSGAYHGQNKLKVHATKLVPFLNQYQRIENFKNEVRYYRLF